MSLSTPALYYLTDPPHYITALSLIGAACLTRVSAVMFWLVPLLVNFMRISWRDRLITTPLAVFSTVIVGVLVDSMFYGRLTLSWWNFFHWNIVKRVSLYYGEESPFYHVKVTLPLMINTGAVYFIYGGWRAVKMRKGGLVLLTASAFLLLNSLQRHKETRFLAPFHPLSLLLCAFGAQQLDLQKSKLIRAGKWLLLTGTVLSQVPISLFYGRAHYSGAYEIVDKLRDLVDTRPANTSSVFFLTPCHVAPFQGYLNRDNVLSEFIKCHPKVVDEVMPPEDSEARDHFQYDPLEFVKSKVIEKGFTHIILFEGELYKYESLLSVNYSLCARSSKPLIPRTGGSRARGDALIYCKQ